MMVNILIVLDATEVYQPPQGVEVCHCQTFLNVGHLCPFKDPDMGHETNQSAPVYQVSHIQASDNNGT